MKLITTLRLAPCLCSAALDFAITTPDSELVVLNRNLDTLWRSLGGDTILFAESCDHAHDADFLGGLAPGAYRLLVPRTVDTASTATPTPNCDSIDQYDLTALAAAATFGVPTGTPVNGQKLIIRILDNGTAQPVAWNSDAGGYYAIVALPTTTVLSKTLYVGFIYNSVRGKWDCVASSQEP